MPILPPRLDDHNFRSLVDELVARIPAHTPEWTNPRPGDPGRTLVELFAWLGDAILYRANLIPERQRLAFLRLLGEPMRAAVAARGIVTVSLDEDQASDAVDLAPLASLEGPVPFETRGELTVLPVTAEVYVKSPLSDEQREELADVIHSLESLYGLEGSAEPYTTTPVFAGGASSTGLDPAKPSQAVDRSLWLALLATSAEAVPAVRETLRGTGRRRLLNVGVAPALALPDSLSEVPERVRIPHTWEMSTPEPGVYLALEVVADSSAGLSRQGVLRLAVPGGQPGAPPNDVYDEIRAGVGDRPPRLDDPDRGARLVTWLRLVPGPTVRSMPLTWVGTNAVEIDQRRTLSGIVVGTSDGTGGQEMPLPGTSVEAETLVLQVEEKGRGYVAWQATGDLATAGRDEGVFRLDSEAGAVRFGDGVRGRIPALGARVRVARMRHGGGDAGNLAAGRLQQISARDRAGGRIAHRLAVGQPLATAGGVDAETLEAAEQRIPALLKNRDRAVTGGDFRRLAAGTPGVRLGRVEVLPRFEPRQRRSGVPGVVSVAIWPLEPLQPAPNPRPDRPLVERVHAWLDERRPLATELHVIGCEYVPLGLAAAVQVRDGFDVNQVLHAVRAALRQFLWPLAPGGPDGGGWTLGRAVSDRELEVQAARVPGVGEVAGVRLFESTGGGWRALASRRAGTPVSLALSGWQLPELQSVVVVEGDEAPPEPRRPGAGGGTSGIAVPVVPEVC